MQKVVIAPDSFKGCLSSAEVAASIARGVHSVLPECRLSCVAVADGGEGTVDALVSTLGGIKIEVDVAGPLMAPVKAVYGVSADGRTAIMEMASASGLPLVPDSLRNPMKTTTYGTGQMIMHAIRSGCRKVLIGIGGSATNDGGLGMLHALGFRFFDCACGEIAPGCGADLSRVECIDSADVPPEVRATEFVVACDVTNPLCGPGGAAHVFARQKGADTAMIEQLDAGMRHFASVIERSGLPSVADMPGAGAAGGLGGAFVAFLDAELKAGIDMVLDAAKFDTVLADADLVITGEGRLDGQTAMGKAPQGVLRRAQRCGVPVVAIGGAVQDARALNEAGFAAVFSVQQGPVTLSDAIKPEVASANISRTVAQIIRLFNH